MMVYDEADELFQPTNQECFHAIKKHLSEKLNITPQHCLYSATFNDDVIDFTRRVVGEVKMFPMPKEALRLKGVQNYKMRMAEAEKTEFVSQLHTKLDKAMTMVFVNRKDSATQLQARLLSQNIKAKILIGGLDVGQRDSLIDDFRKGVYTTLISTNVLARGIDVPEVDLVINYDVPMVCKCGFFDPDYANFMHRVGRTGRFGTDGLALTLMSTEIDQELVELLSSHYQIEINELKSFDQLATIFGEMRSSLI